MHHDRRTILFSCLAFLLLAAVRLPARSAAGTDRQRTPYYQQQLAATELTEACFRAVKELRLSKGIPIDRLLDPNETGLIGMRYSPLTSCVGSVWAKRTTTNPNFAALFVSYFKRIGLGEGNVVAVGASGSFPALIIAVLAAARVLGADPLLIYSVGASQFGANVPGLTLPDMMRFLNERGLLPYRLSAVSLELEPNGRVGFFQRAPAPFLDLLATASVPAVVSTSLEESVSCCRRVFADGAGGRPIRCFVNLGAARGFSGDFPSFLQYSNGLNFPPAKRRRHRSPALIGEFLDQGVPVINFIRIKSLARRVGLGADPIPLPRPGEGGIYYTR